ncbi:hypothetical protein OpiT1DRAFT_02202 [Opitutaceae bacterium TAV1]|nr:hypothetical protein OpiT1DRAFT_02202 [Opitutaceae bacterium TAV1]
MKIKLQPKLRATLALITTTAAVAFAAQSTAAEPTLLFTETFTNTALGTANQNLAALGWHAYGGPEAAGLSNVKGADLNTALIAAAPGNPSDTKGFLALILSNRRPSWPAYAVVKTDLNLTLPKDAPVAITWRMNGAPGSTVRVRLLVQIAGLWYASDTSDTNKEYYEPTHQGTGADFAAADEKAVLKTHTFTRDALDWRTLTLDPNKTLQLGDTTPSDLSANAPITGIGFHITGGSTGRIDTLEIRTK